MRVPPWVLLIAFCVSMTMSFPVVSHASDFDDPNRKALGELLTELERKIEEADQRMIAHPRFLDELRALVDQYRARLREIFLSEDFSDGNYTRDPQWVVDAGRFQITPSRRLFSQVGVQRPASPSSSAEETSPLGIIVEGIIRSTIEEREGEGTAQAPSLASIHTVTQIGPAFEVDLTLVSRSSWGSMEVVLLGGEPPAPQYRMIYHAAPSPERPIEIIRERGVRSYRIEAATEYPALDDGAPHRVQWIRDAQGNMRVLVDGKETLSTVELFYRTAFSGLALVNRGGTYEWGPVRVLQAP